MPSPVESKHFLLSYIGANDGVTYHQLNDFVSEKKLWFGPREDLISFLSDQKAGGRLEYIEENETFLLIRP